MFGLQIRYYRTSAKLLVALVFSLPLLDFGPAQASFPANLEFMFGGGAEQSPVVGRSDGGGLQGEPCNLFNRLRLDASAQERFKALVPSTNQSITVSPYPVFWFYIPVGSDIEADSSYLEFDVEDRTGRSLLSEGAVQTALPQQPGIIGIHLPQTAEALEVGNYYQWSLKIGCESVSAANYPSVYGQIERISSGPDLIHELATGSTDGKHIAYAASGAWHETVTALARNVESRRQHWTAFLGLFDLGAIAPTLSVQEIVFPTEQPPLSLTFPAEEPMIGRSRTGAVQHNDACNAYHQARIDVASVERLVALMPASHQGTTMLPYPTFWFYVPLERANQPTLQYLEFELVDDIGQSVLGGNRLQLPVPERPEILGMTLPHTVAPLQVNQQYHWRLTLICDPDNQAANSFIYGGIKQIAVEEELIYQLETASDETRYSILAQHGLWHEMVTQLVKQRYSYPQEWADLLGLFGLEAIADDVVTQSLPFQTIGRP